MKRLFVDTAGWMSMADRSNPLHSDSRIIRDNYLEQGYILVTSDYVIDETLTLIGMRIGIDGAKIWWEQVIESPRLRFELITIERAEKARAWFLKWRDKPFSFTDCTSFVLMSELQIKHALTTDRHFVEAGFSILPVTR